MNLTQLLAYLLSVKNRLVEFFSTLYLKIKAAALYAYDWAKDAGSKAYRDAVQTILYYYNLAKGLISVAVKALEKAIDFAILTAYAKALYYYNKAILAINAIIAVVWNAVWDWILDVRAWALDKIDTAKVYVLYILAGIRITLQNQLNELLPFLDWLKKTSIVISAANLSMLVDFFNRGYSFLLAFLSNPIGFLFGIMWAQFPSFLSAVLGYGMGSVKYSLPPIPVWGGAGGGGYPGGVYPPPGEIGELAKPLQKLYISGYRFNPPHNGLDLGLVRSDPVYAMHSGTVETTGWSTAGYGFRVTVKGKDWWTLYAHLESIYFAAGQAIDKGAVLGLGNSTGNSTGDHLHLEIKYKGSFVDPAIILGLG